MDDKITKNAQKKESRARTKIKFHRAAFIAEYTEKKYNNIYKEAKQFYEKLYKRYPNKTKLSTCPEFKTWETEIENAQKTTPQPAPSTITDLSSTDNMQINIQLMDASDVQETQDTLMFQNIQPSLIDEINPKILDEIIKDLRECTDISDIFNYIEHEQDIEDIGMNIEIDNDINELTPLERELLNY